MDKREESLAATVGGRNTEKEEERASIGTGYRYRTPLLPVQNARALTLSFFFVASAHTQSLTLIAQQAVF